MMLLDYGHDVSVGTGHASTPATGVAHGQFGGLCRTECMYLSDWFSAAAVHPTVAGHDAVVPTRTRADNMAVVRHAPANGTVNKNSASSSDNANQPQHHSNRRRFVMLLGE